jgi:hypothetical protein
MAQGQGRQKDQHRRRHDPKIGSFFLSASSHISDVILPYSKYFSKGQACGGRSFWEKRNLPVTREVLSYHLYLANLE